MIRMKYSIYRVNLEYHEYGQPDHWPPLVMVGCQKWSQCRRKEKRTTHEVIYRPRMANISDNSVGAIMVPRRNKTSWDPPPLLQQGPLILHISLDPY